jgi:hypothetical protein
MGTNSCWYETIARGIAVRTLGVTYYFWMLANGTWRYRTTEYGNVAAMAHHAKNA